MPEASGARRLLVVGWVVAGLVPVGLVLTFVLGPAGADTAAKVLVVIALIAETLGPALIYGAARWARVARGETDRTGLGWAAVILHIVSIGFLIAGLVFFAQAAKEGSLASLGLGIGAGMLIAISLLPWLASVITGSVLGHRATR